VRAVFDGHALVASGYRLPRTAPDPGRGTAQPQCPALHRSRSLRGSSRSAAQRL